MARRTRSFLVFVAVASAVILPAWIGLAETALELRLGITLDAPGRVQVFWDTGRSFRAEESLTFDVPEAGRRQSLRMKLPPEVRALRLDPRDSAGRVGIVGPSIHRVLRLDRTRLDPLRSLSRDSALRASEAEPASWVPRRDVAKLREVGNRLRFVSTGEDPQLVMRSVDEAVSFGKTVEMGIVVVAGLVAAVLASAFVAGGLGAVLRFGFSIAFVAIGVVLIGMLALDRASAPEPTYRDDAGDYDLSFLDHSGRRISETYGPLGVAFDPFTLYRNLPGQRSDVFTIGPNGLRGEPVAGLDTEAETGAGSEAGAEAGAGVGVGVDGRSAAERPTAIVLGGSAAFGWGLGSDDESFAALLDGSRSGYAFRNAGVVGYVSGQELSLWIHYLDALQPRLVVAFHGWNDLLEAQDPLLGVNTAFFTLSRRLANYHTQIVGEDPPFLAVTDADAAPGSEAAAALPSAAASPLDLYVSNVIKMDAWARARGARFVAVLQPTLFAKELRVGAEREIEMPDRIGEDYLRFCRDARRALEEAGVECHDANRQPEFRDATDELFLDPVHLDAAGHRAAAALIERLLGE